jgi:hypothetical protein
LVNVGSEAVRGQPSAYGQMAASAEQLPSEVMSMIGSSSADFYATLTPIRVALT